MSRKKWRGYAEFEIPDGEGSALMTVCPGNPDQEGRRFQAIMKAAGAKLDRLYIIEAGDLGYHNLKRLVPKNEARAFARLRGERWLENHKPSIDRYMGSRCEVIPMREIVSDPSYERRVELIREIYTVGNNPVREWFDYSIGIDIETRARRKAREGIIMEPWAIRESALDYLCDEYAMLSLMWKNFRIMEIYSGLSVTEQNFFQRENLNDPDIDLTIPPVFPIKLHDARMVRDKGRGRAVPSGEQKIPDYAVDLGASINKGNSFTRQRKTC